MSEVKRTMFSETIYNLDGEPRGSVRRAYVLASDYDRDLAEMRRQRDEAVARVAELEGAIKDVLAGVSVNWPNTLRAALTPKEPRDG